MNKNELVTIISTLSPEELSNAIIASGKNISFIDELKLHLGAERKELKKEQKEQHKQEQSAERERLTMENKPLYQSWEVGHKFQYRDANAVTHNVAKIQTKSNTGKTAACELLNPPADSKTAKRYPKYYQIVMSATLSDGKTELKLSAA